MIPRYFKISNSFDSYPDFCQKSREIVEEYEVMMPDFGFRRVSCFEQDGDNVVMNKITVQLEFELKEQCKN